MGLPRGEPFFVGGIMQIKVDADIQQAQKYLRKVGERNIPLAVAQSLTVTAKHLKTFKADQ